MLYFQTELTAGEVRILEGIIEQKQLHCTLSGIVQYLIDLKKQQNQGAVIQKSIRECMTLSRITILGFL